MGGKNHQPCGQYIKNSTKISRFMSLAFMELEQANIALEDTILIELGGGRGDINDIVTHLVASTNFLDDMQGAVTDLQKQMTDLHYADLPPLEHMDLAGFGQKLFADGLHTSQSDYNDASEIMANDGFWGMITVFENRIGELINQTSNLREEIVETHTIAEAGELHQVLEQNGEGNFKPAFAKLYTSWASFQQLFLASSLISTEIWYRFNKSGSLVDETGEGRVAA